MLSSLALIVVIVIDQFRADEVFRMPLLNPTGLGLLVNHGLDAESDNEELMIGSSHERLITTSLERTLARIIGPRRPSDAATELLTEVLEAAEL